MSLKGRGRKRGLNSFFSNEFDSPRVNTSSLAIMAKPVPRPCVIHTSSGGNIAQQVNDSIKHVYVHVALYILNCF